MTAMAHARGLRPMAAVGRAAAGRAPRRAWETACLPGLDGRR